MSGRRRVFWWVVSVAVALYVETFVAVEGHIAPGVVSMVNQVVLLGVMTYLFWDYVEAFWRWLG